MQAAVIHLDLTNQLDNDLFNHIAYVSNQSLLIMKREGIQKEQRIAIGKMLWRLYLVIGAYNKKKEVATLRSLLNEIQAFIEVFTGG